MPNVVVTFSPVPHLDEALEAALDPLTFVRYLDGEGERVRLALLEAADVVIMRAPTAELTGDGEFSALRYAGLVQLLSAGVDHVPFDRFPAEVTVASNAGAYAIPVAEHALALTLALAKRLRHNQLEMTAGASGWPEPTRAIRGSVAGILGFGGIGQECARAFRALGMTVHAISRRGEPHELADRAGKLTELDALLPTLDTLLVCLPLTSTTRGLIGEPQLALMKDTAILVNVARAAIVDQAALYERLRATPSFAAGLDVWWDERQPSGSYASAEPFLKLPNVIGSPHNSGHTVGAWADAMAQAAANVGRFLHGGEVRHVVDRAEYTTAP